MKQISEIRNGLGFCLFLWTVFHLLPGCTQTEVVDEPQLPQGGKEVQATFHLNVLANRDSQTRSIAFTADGTIETDSIPTNPKDTVRTKAADQLPEGEESRIAQLWIGQYDADGNWIFNQYFPTIIGGKVDVRLKDSGGKKHHVWFVVNGGDLKKIDTEAALKKHVLTYSSSDVGLPSNQLCGMTGIWDGVISEGGVESINVDLTRLVAKISFAYLIGGTDFSFTPTSVTLNSVPDRYRIEVPTGQLTTDVTYKTYSGTASRDGATMYWYLPENMAGTVNGENAVESEKKKTGQGVTDVTYIELKGGAVQSGVTYENVSIRFYPGSGMNNYDIERNSHYTMNVTLAGIDITDERITVGTIPPVEVDPGNMPAGIGGEKELQITARPGQGWVIRLPGWLSALINGKDQAIPESSISYQGPAQLLFKAETANPKAETRSFSFPLTITGEEQTIEIVQDGSTLKAGSTISLGAASGSEGSSTFTATKGLPWRAVLSDGSWLGWAETNPATSGNAATGEKQNLIVRAMASNPYAKERPVTITVEGGESVGNLSYTGLTNVIAVSQAASKVTCPSVAVTVTAEEASNITSSFSATAGLSWQVAVSEENKWIGLTGQTTGTTTGESQNVTFNVPVNPNSSVRSGTVAVRVGDESEGPTGTIAVQQGASSLTVEDNSTPLEPTVGTTTTLGFTGTKGLSYNIVCPDWLEFTNGTTGTTTGSRQAIEYKTNSVNKNKEVRKGDILVKAGNIEKETAVTQKASVFNVEPRTIELPNTISSAEATITGTPGLSWELIKSEDGDAAITAESTSGDVSNASQSIKFNALANEGGARSADFIITVTDGNHSDTVTVKQTSGLNTITIDQVLADAYKNYKETNYSKVRAFPFNYDSGNCEDKGPYGGDYKGNSEKYTVDSPYTIEVEAKQSSIIKQYITGIPIQICKDKGEGWRVPTIIELYAIWDKCRGNNLDATDNDPATYTFGDGFNADVPYWSSSVGLPYYSVRTVVYFTNGVLNTSGTSSNPGANEYPVRCVREK
ncbi:DUF4906 domain-containing protein [Parabacteroides faecis]|uniref:BACON domain-containing protein n=1 Tax=Parabacteroides TaxID=375288 RepID=UPI000EFEE827|nr:MULTISPECIES: BACON domain-containing carbohydrate-binding protein [Parabacteroides]MBC8620324.1 DUF4906 domain-containing protein [Parabacteroides faecis]RHR96666.1 DUF4906 domain-containing protein [Parabacteroides sp. AF14-59]